jgi:hypothetical protein
VSRYRSDLSAAHERIAQLEDELALSKSGIPAAKADPPPPPPGAIRARATIVAAVFATAGVVVGIYEHEHHHDADDHVAREMPLAMPAHIERPRAAPQLQASWSGATDTVPNVIDVDGDGEKDIVGVFSRTDGRYAIAIDGQTFKPKWTTGPFGAGRGELRLTVTNGKVVVATEDTHLRTLALATGRVLSDLPIDGAVTELCSTDVSGRVLLRRSVGQDQVSLPAYFSVDEIVLRAAPSTARCTAHPARCVDVTSKRPCAYGVGADGPPVPKAVTAGFIPSRIFEDHDLLLALGSTPSDKVRGETRALGFTRGAKTPAWEGSIAFSIDRLRDGHVRHDLAGGRLVSLYETEDRMWRVIAHDAGTGSELWYAVVPHTGEWSRVTAFGVEGPYVFVAADGTLNVIDAATGKYLRGLDATTL